MKTASSEADSALLNAFSTQIETGNAKVVLSSDKKWELLKKLSCFSSSGRIEPSKLLRSKERELFKNDPIIRMKQIVDGLQMFKLDACLTDDSDVLICGDGFFEIGLICKYSALVEHAKEVFDWPQHIYVFSQEKPWCFSYMFEDYMFWGGYTR